MPIKSAVLDIDCIKYTLSNYNHKCQTEGLGQNPLKTVLQFSKFNISERNK